MKILGIDPGARKIGLAISDETGLVARPLIVLTHRSRAEDAQAVARVAAAEGAGRIVVGSPLEADGAEGPRARRVRRWAGALDEACGLPVEFWDESFSTASANALLEETGRGWDGRRRSTRNPEDAIAAAFILQSYLDAHRTPPERQADA